MQKILPLIKKYWYIVVIAIMLVGYLLRKKKVEPINKDNEAENLLIEKGIRDLSAQNSFKSIASQIANGLGTAYPVYDPRRWSENDEEVYNLVSALSLNEFKIVSELYFSSYAKGRSLSTDLAKLLDKKYYSILKIK